MSEYVMEFTLRQDSPMIHFQGNTPGATLRASEVKPKLDRFLTKWCKRKGIEERKEWKTDQDHNAYAYKMRIYAGGTKRSVPGKLPSYFGDLDQQRTNLWYTDDVRLEILCFNEELRKVIREAIESFFVLHNFGTRQNRGIGGFTLKQTTPQKAEEILVDWHDTITVYKMNFNRGTNAVEILKSGNMFYQILKSGINHGGTYIKSYLTIYFLERKVRGNPAPQLIGGEKRWMKQNKIAPAIGRSASEPVNRMNVNDSRYIRAILGTTGSIRYQNGRGGTETIKISSDELERVPSPIRYKLVGNVLFIIPLKPGQDLYGKKFIFENENGVRHSLLTPLRTEITMQGLMEGYIRYLRRDVRDDVRDYARNNHMVQPIWEGRPATWIQRCE